MREELFKLIKNLGIPAFLRFSKHNNLTVLSLHRISNDDDYFFQPIRPSLFEELLKYVQKHYAVIKFADLDLFNVKSNKPPLILSFDDGYYDFIEYALPLLTKYNIPCNHNLVNECLSNNAIIWTQQLNDCFNYFKKKCIFEDEDLLNLGFSFAYCNNNWFSYYLAVFQFLLNKDFLFKIEILNKLKERYGVDSCYRMMNWEDAKVASLNNVEIGSHSFRHDSLNTLTVESEMELEIGESKKQLELKLEMPINIIAFPNGQFNKNIEKYCQQIGFRYILLVNDRLTSLNQLKMNFSHVNRIGLANESFFEMISRIELFHSKIKSLR